LTTDDITSRLREFTSHFFRGHVLRDDEDIFASGFVNSMFAMQLVQFVETEFGITVENDDLEIDNFRTLSAMAALVGRKQGLTA
jgi:acyl carrier protein